MITSRLSRGSSGCRFALIIGQVMNSVAKGFDESKVSKQLDDLERMIREGSGEEAQTT